MIHVVCCDIESIGIDEYRRLFDASPAERQERARRYVRQEDKVRCVTAHALVRYAVEKALNLSEFTVERDEWGKPHIQGREDFHFNLSHSGSWVVIAYGESPVGVDVERIRMEAGKENIARRHFTPEEQEYLFSAGEENGERFFEIWTAKESYLKYLGTGLRRSLNSFSVVPDGTGLGVRFTGRRLGDSYLTVCTRQEDITFTQLTPGQLG